MPDACDTTRLVADIGGSKIAVGRVETDGRIVERIEAPTPRPGTPDAVIDALLEILRPLHLPSDATVGIAATGRVVEGRVHAVNVGTLPGWEDVGLATTVEAATGLRCAVLNDAHAATYGEWIHGAGRGSDASFAFVTISTGIGAGAIVNGRLLTGAHGLGAHIGFLPRHDRPDALEQRASGRALARRASEIAGRPIDAREALRRVQAGDPAMNELLRDVVDELAVALAQLQWIVDPERIAIGGGLGLAEGILGSLAERVAARLVGTPGVASGIAPELVRAQLGADAGLVGVAAWMEASDGP